jgi:transcriptional regulator NrdR family protein
MFCSRCGTKTKVTDSRSADSKSVRSNYVTLSAYMGRYTQDWVYRRRRCEKCKTSFSTVELSFDDLKDGWIFRY